MGWVFRGLNRGRLASPLSNTNLFCRGRVGDDCQHHRGSRVVHATRAALGDLQGQAVSRRFLTAARTSWRRCGPTTSEVIFSSSSKAE